MIQRPWADLPKLLRPAAKNGLGGRPRLRSAGRAGLRARRAWNALSRGNANESRTHQREPIVTMTCVETIAYVER